MISNVHFLYFVKLSLHQKKCVNEAKNPLGRVFF